MTRVLVILISALVIALIVAWAIGPINNPVFTGNVGCPYPGGENETICDPDKWQAHVERLLGEGIFADACVERDNPAGWGGWPKCKRERLDK